MPGYREATIQEARALWASKPVFLDTETTGLHNTAEIIEVCVIDYAGEVLFESLVRPRQPIPPEVVRIHGIIDEMVRTAPNWWHVWPGFEAALMNRNVGVYNAEFDLRMIQQTHQQNGMPWRPPAFHFFDIMKMYANFTGAYQWQTLEDAGHQLGISLPNTHRARDDALLARAVFLSIVNSDPPTSSK